MARKQGSCADLLDFASAPRWRSAVFWASISFVVCHVIAMGTVPLATETAMPLDSDLLPQLLHFAAVFCRFTLPLGFVVGGLVTYLKSKRSQVAGHPRQAARDL
jgi:hypothetical protein